MLLGTQESGFGEGPPSIEYLDVHNVVQRYSVRDKGGAGDSGCSALALASASVRQCPQSGVEVAR